MKKLGLSLLFYFPVLLLAQADTVRFRPGAGNLLTDEAVFEYHPSLLYGHNLLNLAHLPEDGWQPRCNRELIFPSNGKAVALRFWVKNDTEKEQPLVLEIDDLQMDRAKIWVERHGGQIDSSQLSGDLMPFNNRDIAFANPNFNVVLPAGETARIWVYMDQSGLFLRPRLQLWPIHRFTAYASRRQLAAGLFLGIFLLSTLASSIAAVFRILPAAKWYAGFIGVQTLQVAIHVGAAHQFFWPESGRWTIVLSLALPLLGFSLLFKLMEVLLALKSRVPNLHQWLQHGIAGLIAFSGVSYLLYWLGLQKLLLFLYPLGMLLAMGLCVGLMLSCLLVWQKFRERKSLLFLLAFSFGILGAVLSWLTKIGIPIYFNVSRHSVLVGFTLDMLLFNYIIFRDLWQTKTRNFDLQLALADANREAADNLLRGQEEERKRLSMDLHDGVGIELGSIRRRLESRFCQPNSRLTAEDQQIVGDLANVAEQIRKFSHALDPFSAKNLSLPELLDNLLFDFENNSPGVSAQFLKSGSITIENQSVGALTENEKHLFFIAAELLNNVARHAQANVVELRLEYYPDKIILEIADNGIGYSPTSTLSGVGLNHIRSRAQLSGAKFLAHTKAPRGMLHWVEMPFQSNQQNLGQQMATLTPD